MIITVSNNNTIHHNIINTHTGLIYFTDSTNIWDDGNGEGNYWSDYKGIDNDGDGIGDTELPHQGVDYYPLMEPGGPREQDSEGEPSPGSDDWIMTLIIILFFLIILVWPR